jgi:hypothetical protein
MTAITGTGHHLRLRGADMTGSTAGISSVVSAAILSNR